MKEYYTAVGRTVDDKLKTISVTVISNNYAVRTVGADELVTAIKAKKIELTNIEEKDGSVVFSNGSEKNYTTISMVTGQLVSKPAAVILDRIEDKSGKVVGYTVFMPNGTIEKLSVATAADATAKGLVANGKIRHTAEGDIVSSIKGNYNLCVVDSDDAGKKSKEVISMGVMFFANAIHGDKEASYAGVILSCDSAVKISECMKKVITNNKALIETLRGFNEKELEALKIQRISVCEFYVVIDMLMFTQIMYKMNGKVTEAKKYNISVLEYDDVNDTPVQSAAAVSKNFDIIDMDNAAGMEKDVTDFIAKLRSVIKI